MTADEENRILWKTLGKVEQFVDNFQANFGEPLKEFILENRKNTERITAIEAARATGCCDSLKHLQERVSGVELVQAGRIGKDKGKEEMQEKTFDNNNDIKNQIKANLITDAIQTLQRFVKDYWVHIIAYPTATTTAALLWHWLKTKFNF